MKYLLIAKILIELRNADLALREMLIQNGELELGYNEEMEQLHNSNASALDEIIDSIGYPTINKVGKEASEAAWLVIQHAISQPDFMKRCLILLEEAVDQGNANPKDLAYLTDRIAVFEGKTQLYGTQFDWAKNGVLSPQPYDDIFKVNQRRKSIELNTLEEQTKVMRDRTKMENQSPPKDLEERKEEYDKWRKKVGWIK